MAPKGGGKGPRRGPEGVPKGGPHGFRVWVCAVWGSGLNVGFGSLGLGLLGFRQFGQYTKTLKLAKVGQHIKTLKLAKVGLAKVGQAHNWPKSVKGLAKVGLAKSRSLPH